MHRIKKLAATTAVTGAALLALTGPASAQGWPCNGCGDTVRTEAPASEGFPTPAALAALGGLVAAGAVGVAVRRRRAEVA